MKYNEEIELGWPIKVGESYSKKNQCSVCLKYKYKVNLVINWHAHSDIQTSVCDKCYGPDCLKGWKNKE